MKNKRTQIWISTIFAVLVTGAAIYVLKHILGDMTMAELETALGKIHPASLVAALVVTAACYTALSVYDWVALTMLNHHHKWSTALAGGVAAYSLSHNLGFAPITATGARWRIYAPHGIPFGDIARIGCLTGLAFWFGVLFQAGMVLTINPDLFANHLPLSIPASSQAVVGMLIVVGFLGYVFAHRLGLRQIGWRGISIPTASTKQAVIQAVVTMIEIGLASSVLWLLIPGAGIEALASVYIAYLIAFASVLITHTPGGVGVLEAIAIAMLPQLGAANVLVGLLLFRIIFHIVPLLIGTFILVKAPTSPVPALAPQPA